MLSLKKRLGLTALVTAIEDFGLVSWLQLVRTAHPILAVVTLLVTLVSEHLISQEATPVMVHKKQAIQVTAFSALEVVNWAVWLALIPINPVAAAVYFLVSFFIEHKITLNVKRGLPFLNFIGDGTKGVIVETISEFIGAALWIMLGPIAGVIALVIGSSVEHFIASGQ